MQFEGNSFIWGDLATSGLSKEEYEILAIEPYMDSRNATRIKVCEFNIVRI